MGNYRLGRNNAQHKHLKKLTNKSLPAKVKKIILSLKEGKYIDPGYLYAVDYNGTINGVSNVAQGYTDQTRQGDVLEPKSLLLRYKITANNTAAVDNAVNVRIIVFRWHERFGDVAPTPAKILQNVGSIQTPVQHYNHDGRELFTILYDKTHLVCSAYSAFVGNVFLSNSAVTVNAGNILGRHKKKIQYFAGSTTDQEDGIYAMAISDTITAANEPTVNMQFRINYTDS